jgi:hypothetical protein
MAAIRGNRLGTYRLGKRIQRRVLPMLLQPLQQEDFSVRRLVAALIIQRFVAF